MQNSDNDSDYQKELKKLIDQKVVSEKTAQIHLSQIKNQPIIEKDVNREPLKIEKSNKKLIWSGKIWIGFAVIAVILFFIFI